jgi:bifunctional DNase/RNase
MSSEIKLNIVGLVYNQNVAGTYGLVLAEENGKRRFSVMIGEPEAQSIALHMNKKKSPRPLTHDLILTLLSVFGTKLEKVVIYDMVNDIFYAELHLKKGETSMVVDSRTSDAIALAVRAECGIFIKEKIMDIVSVEIEPSELEKHTKDRVAEVVKPDELTAEELEMLPVKDLEELLNIAVSEEKYELAVNLRDTIKRKKNA